LKVKRANEVHKGLRAKTLITGFPPIHDVRPGRAGAAAVVVIS
jgi:hypothetical protein